MTFYRLQTNSYIVGSLGCVSGFLYCESYLNTNEVIKLQKKYFKTIRKVGGTEISMGFNECWEIKEIPNSLGFIKNAD